MTREDIIRMAREAGSIDSEDVIETVYAAFSAAEREACAKVCDLEFAACWHADAISQAKEAKRCADAIRERGDK